MAVVVETTKPSKIGAEQDEAKISQQSLHQLSNFVWWPKKTSRPNLRKEPKVKLQVQKTLHDLTQFLWWPKKTPRPNFKESLQVKAQRQLSLDQLGSFVGAPKKFQQECDTPESAGKPLWGPEIYTFVRPKYF